MECFWSLRVFVEGLNVELKLILKSSTQRNDGNRCKSFLSLKWRIGVCSMDGVGMEKFVKRDESWLREKLRAPVASLSTTPEHGGCRLLLPIHHAPHSTQGVDVEDVAMVKDESHKFSPKSRNPPPPGGLI
jgi:hypothetical protein